MDTYVSRISLSDGTPIRFRRIRPGDTARLSRAFGRLSPRSRYLRFLAPVASLSDKQLRAFVDVDFVDHVALAAELSDERGRSFVGVGRWIRSSHDPHVAELAVTVVDDYQRRGLGLAILARLAQMAEARDIQWFAATVLAENLAVRRALSRFGAKQAGYDMGAYTFHVPVSACVGAERLAPVVRSCSHSVDDPLVVTTVRKDDDRTLSAQLEPAK